jgi:hypothetical protein
VTACAAKATQPLCLQLDLSVDLRDVHLRKSQSTQIACRHFNEAFGMTVPVFYSSADALHRVVVPEVNTSPAMASRPCQGQATFSKNSRSPSQSRAAVSPSRSSLQKGAWLCSRSERSVGHAPTGFILAGRLVVGPDPRRPKPETTAMTLSDTQALILRQAAEHEAGLAPLPKIPAAARNAVVRSMLKGGLLVEVTAPPEYAGRGWLQDEAGAWIALRITDNGLAALDLEPAGSAPVLPAVDTQEIAAPVIPPLSPEAASSPQDAPTLRPSLRAASAAVITAWEASQPLDAALASLRANLASRPARAPRAAGTPRRRREGTKQAAVLALLRRPEGATVAQVVDATGWAPHTVRGFFAGLRTRHGIKVTVLERGLTVETPAMRPLVRPSRGAARGPRPRSGPAPDARWRPWSGHHAAGRQRGDG